MSSSELATFQPSVPTATGSARVSAIEIAGLHYNYPDGTAALDGIELRVEAGERVALMGLNGAGKSTLLMHLNGILRGTGQIRILGHELTDATVGEIRAQVGFVFQNPDDQLFSPSVWDDVAYGPLYMGLDRDEIERRVDRALAAVGMRDVADKLPHHLSLGQRKRVSLATVLSMEPSILVLDEPTAGLDPAARRQLIELLDSLPQTLLFATHDMRFARDSATRALIMQAGRIVADGPVAELLADGPTLERYGLELP